MTTARNPEPQSDGHALISASILGADWLAFGSAIRVAEEVGSDLIQIDIADGIFTPTITFGEELVRRVRSVSALPVEAHLMVSRPQDWIPVMASVGADVVIFHAETVYRLYGTIQLARQHGLCVGVALNSETPVESLEYVLPYIDLVTLMGIAPGFAGQAFIPETIDKIRRLRALVDRLGLRVGIEVDGGVKIGNAAAVIEAGADVLVLSSAIYGAESAGSAVRGIRQEMGRGWSSRATRDGANEFLARASAHRRGHRASD